MKRTLLVGLMGAFVFATTGQTAFAQLDEQNKLLAKRAAEADCYRKLAETIKGLEIISATYVRDFVTESDTIEASLNTFIKGVRLGRATYYDDGTCEVEAEVTVADIVTHLKELHTRHYQGNRIVGTDFDKMEQKIVKKIIKVIGAGAPRQDLPPGVPGGGGPVQTPASPTRSTSYPANWSAVPAQAKLMAARAARMDAQRKLLERIMGVRINSETLVRDFITETDEIVARAEGIVVGAEETRRYFHHDELIVEVTMSVPTEQVIRTITELHTRHYQGNRVTGTDITRIRENIKRKTFEATGAGVPPRKYMPANSSATGPAPPEWSFTKITATGNGTDPEIGTAQGRLKALRAATLDARRNLIERLHGLRLTSSTLVRDFITERDEINAQLQSVIAGSVVENRRVEADLATVTISVGGPDVWTIVHSQLRIESRR